MLKYLFIAGMITLAACGSSKNVTGKANSDKGDTRSQKIEYINDETYLVSQTTDDKTYGYDQSNPVKVGGSKENSGPRNERRFLNGLLGPNGEKLDYHRRGSCCAFQSPNAMIGGMALLDAYEVYWKGGKDTLTIYINMYDKGDLMIPVGLTAKKK